MFNYFQTNGLFHYVTYDKARLVHCFRLIGQRLYVPKNIVFHSLKVYFALANNADTDEMPHNAEFHLGLHCFTKYPLRGFWSTQG